VLAIAATLAGCSGRSPGSETIRETATVAMPASRTPIRTETMTPSLTLVAETATPQSTPTYGAISSCGLPLIAVPTMVPYPGAFAVDPTTGLHMTGRPVLIDLTSYRLQVTGLVDHPLSLSYEDLRCMPKVTAKPTLVCTGLFEDTASWTGVPLNYILDLAGVKSEAKWMTMVGADGYENQIVIQAARDDGNFLAYELNAQTLPVLHGFPLRAVFPSLPGKNWVKWLVEIKVE
jgi:hypothetical protein